LGQDGERINVRGGYRMTVAKLLAIDLGTSAVKVLITTQKGDVLGQGSAEYPILRPRQDWAEQSPASWWQATVKAVKMALAENDAVPATISAIGLSGQMHGTVLLDDAGRSITPAVIWLDRRSRRQVAEITDIFGAERLVQVAGSPIATGFQAATIRWFKQEAPDLWSRVAMILTPKDYLRWRLTNRFQTEPSDGSGTLLFDIRLRNWSTDLLQVLDIEAARLPPVATPETVAGNLGRQAAVELGLATGIPIIVGAADTACALIGAGVVDARSLLIALGTGGQIIQPASTYQPDASGRIHTFCSALRPGSDRAGWYQMAAILTAGMALRWLRKQVFGLSDQAAYGQMMVLAEETQVGAGGLLFLPYLAGERTPHMDPKARGLFLGLTAAHGRGELIRAVMEGVVLACYDAYGVLEKFSDQPEGIIVAGGASRNKLWHQIVSDVFDLPVRPLVITQQSAYGAAIVAGAGIGLFDLKDAAQKWARYGPVVEPDPGRHAVYMEMLTLFRSAYQKHRADFRQLWKLEMGQDHSP
jgi:xylulokinase